jgi:cysteine-rich repeat protein
MRSPWSKTLGALVVALVAVGCNARGHAVDDAGPTLDGGCARDCAMAVCGDGIVAAGESCDDGNTVDGDGCDHDCTVTACGNGIVAAGEACDDGNTADGDACEHDCALPGCGNGIVDRGETCDDGNASDGDGCDARCQLAACTGAAPVAAGMAGSFPLAGQIDALVADPRGCLIYALDTGAPSHLVVISAATKRELTRVSLPRASELAVSPNGAYVVVSHDADHAISVLDPVTWRVARRVPTFADPYGVTVTNDGIAFYTEEQVGVHRIDLRNGGGDGEGGTLLYYAAIAQSRDGQAIYVASGGTSGSEIAKYDITSGILVLVGANAYEAAGGGGFYYPARHVYPSPDGRHVYYADRQLDADAIGSIRGTTGEPIYAEDAQGRFAVGAAHVFDAELVRPIAALGQPVDAAALTAGDQELWTYRADTGRIAYQNTQELIGGASFGVRERAPQGPYTFARLIHDPVRPRLYGIDAGRGAVVVIDAVTLQPVREIVVGGVPRDAAIDATGTTLFVGNDEVLAVARIALATPSFERFVPTPHYPARLAAVGGGRLMTVDLGGLPTLLDASSGSVISQAERLFEGSALGATADGGSVFVGQASPRYGDVVRYSLATGALVAADRSHYMGFGFFGPERAVTAVPDGSGVYYARHFLNGHDLSVVPYEVDGPILAVSPDSRLALSATSIYDVASGTKLGTLPVADAVAIRPDSAAAFVATAAGVQRIALTAFAR